MTLKIQSYTAPRPTVVTEKDTTHSFTDNPPNYNDLGGGRRRKADKVIKCAKKKRRHVF